MATLSASRRNSANSAPSTPRPSLSGKMSSLCEENADENEDEVSPIDNVSSASVDDLPENDEGKNGLPIDEYCDSLGRNAVQTRTCSNRSDSGVSDCSSHLTSSSCNSTPLLKKKLLISDTSHLIKDFDIDTSPPKFVSNTSIILSNSPAANKSNSFQSISNEKNNVYISTEENKKGNGLDCTINTLTRRATAKCEYIYLFELLLAVCLFFKV